jgi:hypothetical protein
MVPDAAFARAADITVQHTTAGEDAHRAIVHFHGELHNYCAIWPLDELKEARAKRRQMRDSTVELLTRYVERV